jgi:hypothetical protein
MPRSALGGGVNAAFRLGSVRISQFLYSFWVKSAAFRHTFTRILVAPLTVIL